MHCQRIFLQANKQLNDPQPELETNYVKFKQQNTNIVSLVHGAMAAAVNQAKRLPAATFPITAYHAAAKLPAAIPAFVNPTTAKTNAIIIWAF